MNSNLIDNLKKLCNQPGISGFEKESGISDFLFNLVKDINQETKFDSSGNIVSIIKGGGQAIILEAHMDETGFLVSDIKENVILSPQGIIKGEKVDGNDVFILGKEIEGKISIGEEGEFIFDLVAQENFNKVEVGDLVAFKRSFIEDANEVKACALDNRIGCSALLEVLKDNMQNGLNRNLVFVFSRKEEIDQSLFSDIIDLYKDAAAIVVDAAYAQPVDFDINIADVAIPILGAGCAIQSKGKGFDIADNVVNEIKGIAQENNIKIQDEKAPVGMGKTNFAQMLRQGIKDGIVINIPVRNQHHQSAVTNILDAKEAVRLINILISK
jgi:endoglucanase